MRLTRDPHFRLFKPLEVASDTMINLDALRFLAAFGVIAGCRAAETGGGSTQSISSGEANLFLMN